MSIKICWSVLGIPKTNNQREIKKAYAKQTAHCHPEDNPEGFKQLYNAYSEALKFARTHKNEIIDETKENDQKTSSLIFEDELNIKENRETEKEKGPSLSINLDDLRNYQKQQQKPIASLDASPEYDEENIDKELLKIVKKKLSVNLCTVEILNGIFLDPLIMQRVSENNQFKSQLEKLMIQNTYKYPRESIEYLERVSGVCSFFELRDALEKKKKNSARMTIIVVIVILIIFNAGSAYIKKSNEEQQQRMTDNYNNSVRINQENKKNTWIQMQMIEQAKYLNGVTFEYEDFQYKMYDKNEKQITEDTIAGIKFTSSQFVILEFAFNESALFDTKTLSTSKIFEKVYLITYVEGSREENGYIMKKKDKWLLYDLNGKFVDTLGPSGGNWPIRVIKEKNGYTIE